MKPIGDIAYSGSEVDGGSEKSEEEDLKFNNAMDAETLKEFMRYRMGREKNGIRNYVDRTEMHLARLYSWTGCLVTMMDTGVGRGGQKRRCLQFRMVDTCVLR